MYIRPFEIQANTQTISVDVTNTSTAITANGLGNRSLRVVVDGTQTVFISFTSGAGTASVATSCPIVPGTTEVFLLRREITHINTIATASGSTVYITAGESA